MKKILFLFISLAIISCAQKESVTAEIYEPNIIPQPVSYEDVDATFALTNNINLNLRTDDSQVQTYATAFKSFLSDAGITINEGEDSINNTISIQLNEESLTDIGNEGYTLKINQNTINLSANEAAGIFNGLQTLKQFIPPNFKADENNPIALKGATIVDYPRFAWRGLMLDVSRHFFSVEDVKAYIDKMSHYKLNTFHWHLTDDQGWRIEIKSLPKLTEIGAWRVERHGRFGSSRPHPKTGEEATYGGFYTHEQIKDVVQYASD